MADTNQKSVEQQASDVVEMAKKGQKIEQPLSTEIERLAREKAKSENEGDQKKINDALDRLKQDLNQANAQKQNQDVKEMQEILKEINPENLEKAINFSEKAINTLPDGDTKSTLRGIHGAVIFDILRSAGHNLIMQNSQITIVPKPGTDIVNLQEKLQTLVNTNKLSLDTIKLGMLYSSPSFQKYSELKKTTDAKGKSIIDPKASPKDFIAYLTDLQKSGNTSGDIITILGSREMLTGVNMQEAIKGFQDMGQIGNWIENNPTVIQSNSPQSPVIVSHQQAPSSTPSEPNNTLTGKVLKDGVTQGQVTGVVGDATKGLVNGLSDILSLGKGDPLATLGIGAALIYGIYKAFGKFGFLGGLGVLFGAGAMNNIEKIMGRFGVDVGETAGKVKTAAEEAAEKARAAVSGTPVVPPSSEKPTETSTLTPTQTALRQSVDTNQKLKDEITKISSLPNSPNPGTYEEYMKFIEVDLKDIPLSKLFPADHKKSIFHDIGDSELGNNSKLGGRILKKVLRAYLVGNGYDSLTGSGDSQGIKEKDNFMKLHNLTQTDLQTKKLSDILAEVANKRNGSIVPTQPQATSTAMPTQPVQAAAPTQAPTSYKINGIEVAVGTNVPVGKKALVYDATGALLSKSTLLPQEAGKYYIDAGRSVKLTDKTTKIGSVIAVEVTYAGESFYIPLQYLQK